MATVPENEVLTDTDERAKPPFLRRVRIRGYKSIAFCDVCLEPLTILVGRNASGKSNFLDALAFLRDLLAKGMNEAIKLHGGRNAILCRATRDIGFAIWLEFGFQEQISHKELLGEYNLHFGFPSHLSVPSICEESLIIRDNTIGTKRGFHRHEQHAEWFGFADPTYSPLLDWCPSDRLLLGLVGISPFVELDLGIRSSGFYNFNPDAIRRLQIPSPGWLVERDGSNLASVIETTRENDEETIERVGRYLSTITESVELLGVVRYGEYETVRFRIPHADQGQSLEFDAASMSDGTLRTLAALAAAFQIVLPHGHPSLVGIEEPETSLHPAAMRALVDALDEATGRTQILLTTHSAELLESPHVRPENVRVVEMVGGQTVIGPVDEASVEIIRRKLNTLGGLERDNQLEIDLDDRERQQRHRLGQLSQELPP